MAKFVLHDVSIDQVKALRADIQKVRSWLTDSSVVRVPGEDGLRQLQVILDEAIAKASAKKAAVR